MKIIKILNVFTVAFLLFAFSHKYYISIYQIDYNEKKSRLEITSRIFLDDLNKAVYLNSGTKTNIGDKNESDVDMKVFKAYFLSKMTIKINNKIQNVVLKNKEVENNTLICYWVCNNVNQIQNLEIQNSALFEVSEDQQNIVHLNIKGKKSNFVLTNINDKLKVKN